ncbi:MAG: type I 3-dehydroquinate dehydratase [Candidatus Methylomirabilis sp.]|nr:type I 3-dehydroquinate dehydratase [Deltaproteobacteria bacterium]
MSSRGLGKARTAAVITGGATDSAARKAVSGGAGLLEARIDTFRSLDPGSISSSLKRLKEITGLPIILTIRSRAEGGMARLTESERLGLFRELIPYADYVDIEARSSGIFKDVVKSAKGKRKKVIASYHNFRTTPGDTKLNEIIESGRSAGADIIKLATLVDSPGDLRRLARLLFDHKDLIVIGMGALGAASRVFFPIIGSLVTYGSVSGKTAPGQLSLGALKKEFERYGF